ncbi:MAG: nickel pincer cofactor biosynthesis protein LarC [Vicinamibacterales bacterium]
MSRRVLYMDCFSGASGDMVLGACVDVGVPVDLLAAAVESLGIGARLQIERVSRRGIQATKVSVEAPAPPSGAHPHRHLSSILRLIEGAALSPDVKHRASALFRRLGEAEAAVHGVPVERVHFHEVGAIDSIVDVVASVVAIESLDAARVVASPLNTGSGTVHCEHGEMPVPAPATARLLAGSPVYAAGAPGERLTPTGALLVTGYASAYGDLPAMTLQRVGYGAGSRDTPDRPNVLRFILGEEIERTHDSERATIIEAEVDDLNPQILGVLMSRLFDLGVLDAYFTPVQMKKNRPGTLVTVVTRPEQRERVYGVLFAETTTLGVRSHDVLREALVRDVIVVECPYGAVRVKIARRDGRVVNASPEFDDCVRLAEASHVPVKEVLAAAVQAWRAQQGGPAL